MSGKRIDVRARNQDAADYLNQLATLAGGSIVVVGTFAGSEGLDVSARPFAIGMIVCFAAAIVGAMAARLALIYTEHGNPTEREFNGGAILFGAGVAVGVVGFAFGVIALAIFAAKAL
jgi:hypothetical protein